MNKPSNFRSFWPYYLMAHRDPKCRALHFVGSTGAVAGVETAIFLGDPLWLLAGLVFAYAMAWTGHFALERNRPATFGNPIWSFFGDARMYGLWICGRLEPALQSAERTVRPDQL
jgi:hypothetical protein